MNARISKKFFFQAAVHHEKTFLINDYDIQLHMIVATDDIREQNIAMDRIKYLFEFCLENSIFINSSDTKAVDLYSKANIRICPLPEDPYDQIIGIVIMNKCNVIAEEKLIVTSIEIKSKLCDDVVFYISADEEVEFTHHHNVWWNENNPSTNGYKSSKKEKIVELKKEPKDWNSVGLGWKQNDNCDKGEILFIPIDK
jgi:hypothetical protein